MSDKKRNTTKEMKSLINAGIDGNYQGTPVFSYLLRNYPEVYTENDYPIDVKGSKDKAAFDTLRQMYGGYDGYTPEQLQRIGQTQVEYARRKNGGDSSATPATPAASNTPVTPATTPTTSAKSNVTPTNPSKVAPASTPASTTASKPASTKSDNVPKNNVPVNNTVTTDTVPSNGATKYDKSLELLNKQKASVYDSGDLTQNPNGGFNTYQTTLIPNIRNVINANNQLKEAENSNFVSREAKQGKESAKDVYKATKAFDRDLNKLNKGLDTRHKEESKSLVSGLLDKAVGKKSELVSQNTALPDPKTIPADKMKAYNKETDKRAKNKDQIDQLTAQIMYLGDQAQKDFNFIESGKGSPEQIQEATQNLKQMAPEVSDLLNKRLVANADNLTDVAKAANEAGYDDLGELAQNLINTVDMVKEYGFESINPEMQKQLLDYVDQFDDIIKNQREYDRDIRIARDEKYNAINKLVFDIFDQIKSDIVFYAGIQFENPQMIRSSLQQYNKMLEEGEAQGVNAQRQAYYDNIVRDKTMDNIAKYAEKAEFGPQLQFLKDKTNFFMGKDGLKNMRDLEAAFEEYSKYGKEHPSFIAYIQAQREVPDSKGAAVWEAINLALRNAGVLFEESDNNPNKGVKPFWGPGSEEEESKNNSKKSGVIKLNGKSTSWLDNATKKSMQKPTTSDGEAIDMATLTDMQNTIGNSLAARQIQKGMAPQGQATVS